MCETSVDRNDETKGKMSDCVPARYVVGLMCFLGIMFQYTLKVCLSVAIVAMVKPPSDNFTTLHGRSVVDESEVCPAGDDDSSKTHPQDGEFEWDELMQGHVLSGYYYGYVATQLLGGRLSELFGSKIVLGPAVLLAGLLTLLSPVAARWHVGAFIALRVLVGAVSGMVVPAMNNILARWFVKDEKLVVGSFIMTGMTLGTIVAMLLSGVLAEAGGWTLVFYFFGGFSIAFIIPWVVLVFDSPEQHPRISPKERDFIISGNGYSIVKKSLPVPWFAILTSLPMWAHVINGVGYGWIAYTFLSELPTYLSNILHFELAASGALSSMPYFFGGAANILYAYLSQWLRSKGYITKIQSFYIFNGISSVCPALGLLAITLVGCDSTAILVLIVFTLTNLAAFQGGSFISHVDLGNNYAGTLAGINYTIMSAMGFVTPIVTGAVIHEQQTISRWTIVFYISMAVAVGCWLFYLCFGSAEEQSWNRKFVKESQQLEQAGRRESAQRNVDT